MKRIQNRKGLFALALLALFLLSGCMKRTVNPPSDQESAQEETTQEASYPEETQSLEEPAETAANAAGNATQEDQLAGGGIGDLTFEISSVEKQYTAEDGVVIVELRLAYPHFHGQKEGVTAINRYFEDWAERKENEYENDDNSTRQYALEVYRESRDNEWVAPWSEEYQVTSVKTKNGFVSILLDSYLYEGGAHGMPYREGYVFRVSDGKQVELSEMSRMTGDEWDKLLRARFADRIAAEPDMFYEDAPELIKTYDMSKAGSYFADDGIVFYLSPYEIAPYAAGYVEIVIPYEEAALVNAEDL